MAVTHNGTIRDYGEYLQTHPNEVQELVKAFLIKVTGFFRDPEAFQVSRRLSSPSLSTELKRMEGPCGFGLRDAQPERKPIRWRC